MANFLHKSCCNFSKFCVASTNVFMSKTGLKYAPCNSLVLNAFGCKRYIHLERKFCSMLPPGVGIRSQSTSLLCGSSLYCARWIHMTRTRFGIEEFFPPRVLETQQPLPEEIKSGRGWRAAELRQKSNEDLHKLWYVLLKERNMLLTVHEEAKRQEVVMPSPERFHKVKKSMAMIKVVLEERKRAIEAVERNYKEAQTIVSTADNSQGGKDTVDINSEVGGHVSQIPVAT